jgi:hypothetical protein
MVYNWVIYSGEGSEKASEKAEQFLKMIVDPNKRIYFAEKFQNYEVAIDVSEEMKLIYFEKSFVFRQLRMFFVIDFNWIIYGNACHVIIQRIITRLHY